MMGHLKVYRSFVHLQVTLLVERCRTRLLFKGVFRVEGNAIHGLVEGHVSHEKKGPSEGCLCCERLPLRTKTQRPTVTENKMAFCEK